MSKMNYWLKSYWSVLSKPTKQTFITIAQESENRFGEIIAWIEFAIILFFSPMIIFCGGPDCTNGMLVTSMVNIPIWFLIFVFSLHRINQLLSKSDEIYYEKLLFSSGTIFVVSVSILVLIITIADIFQSNGEFAYLLIPPIIYWFVLTVISVKAITSSSFFLAIINVTLSLVISLIGFVFVGWNFMYLLYNLPSYFN